MKFQFCGDLEPPEWILAEIHTLTKITSTQTQLVIELIVEFMLTDDIDFAKIHAILGDTLLQESDIKAVVSSLHFLLSQAVKYNVNESSFSTEIQQLGLPNEHAEILATVYQNTRERIQSKLHHSSLQLPAMKNLKWRVDYILGSKMSPTLGVPSIQWHLDVETHASSESVSFEMTRDKFQALYYELRRAKALMEKIP